jgi:hypothetical protein
MDNNGYTKNDLKAFAERFLEIQAIAKQYGVFTYYRDLLECVPCQLAEDIAFDGRLFTHWKTDKDFNDTGLRFIELDQNKALFQCPNCFTQITAQHEKEY